MTTCRSTESEELCQRRNDMESLKKEYKKLLDDYYKEYTTFLKYSNARGNKAFALAQATNANIRYTKIKDKLAEMGKKITALIQDASDKINGARTQIKMLDDEMYEKNTNILQKQKNIDSMQTEYDTRMQQINSNIEKNRYRRNVMWVFIVSNVIGIAILAYLIFSNLKKTE